MNTKVYLAGVFAALIVIIILAYIFLASSGTKKVPKANQPNPNSSLVYSSQTRRA